MKWFKKMWGRRRLKWLFIGATIFLVGVIIFLGLMGMYQLKYEGSVYKGVRVGGISLAGKSREQARALIQAKVDKLTNDGVEFYYRDKKLVIEPIVSTGSEIGLAYELWLYNVEEISDELYDMGRGESWLESIGEELGLLFFGSRGKVDYGLKEDELKEKLEEYFSEWESPGKDADLVLKNGKIQISEEESGLVFDYNGAIKLLKQDLERIDNLGIEMNLVVDNPKVTKAESEFLTGEAELVLDLAPLTLNFKKPEYYQGRKRFVQNSWYINKSNLLEWLKIKKNNEREAGLGIDQEKVNDYLAEVADIINTPAKDAKFEIKNGRVVEWQSSSDGFSLNISETIDRIERELIKERNSIMEMVLSVDKSKITNENVNDLGINEFLGVGESDFSGSPRNRRHNIAVGAEALNGLLIKPDEEFSLLQALGETDAAAGYKPELVIKKGETVPEYGGGLCQIGTTLFRSVLNTGLSITQRRNHSYRVVYYEPAGTDATIYDPWPDFKFINDTGKHVLLQTRIEGDNLIFEFWGTSDGRVIETTEPVVYNIVPPGEPKYIPTQELKPGEKIRTEIAHSGADAHFIRTITWPKEAGKEPVEEIWYSHYVP